MPMTTPPLAVPSSLVMASEDVMGCLSQRYQKELEEEMPEVDKFYGKFNYKQLLQEP